MFSRLLSHAYRVADRSPVFRRILRGSWVSRWKTALAARLDVRDVEYERWLAARQVARQPQVAVTSEPGLVSFLTTVWNTPPEFLEPAAASVLGQSPLRDFEWVVLDNGSTHPGTRQALVQIALDPRVRLLRVEENQGIVGGMRIALAHATGRYVAPFDSDDLLTPDALTLITEYLQRRHYPPLMYSDEDHLLGRRRLHPYFKPDWDPVLFLNSCYVAHLCVFDRVLAARHGVYSDDGVNGCHDWDTFLRLWSAGHEPGHIPEVLYSWRKHGQSTAANAHSKSYIYSSHRRLLQRALDIKGLADRFDIELSPFFDGAPHWRLRRRPDARQAWLALNTSTGHCERLHGESLQATSNRQAAPRMDQANRPRSTLGHLMGRLSDQSPNALIVCHAAGAALENSAELWDAAGLFDLHHDARVVTGRVARARRVLDAGSEWRDVSRRPSDEGRSVRDAGPFNRLWKQRTIGVAPRGLCVTTARFLVDTARTFPQAPLSDVSAWLSIHASRSGLRVAYTPFLIASTDRPLADWEPATRRELAAQAARMARGAVSAFPSHVDHPAAPAA